jgi:transcription elongation factor GreA
MQDQIISHDGYEKLKKELEHLTTFKRREIADRIEKAKELGDLSENAEYQDAKEAQAFNEGRVGEIKALLKNLTVVQNGSSKESVGMGSNITVAVNGSERKYTIVSFNEVDPTAGKISNESPIGRAFIGRQIGEVVVVPTPKGDMTYKILSIE